MPTELEPLRAQIEAEREAHAAEVSRLRAALTNTKAAIYGEHGKPSLLGHGHNARYDCGFIANWHSDPNCKIEETARHAEALLLEVHQMTVKVAHEIEAALAAPPTAAVEAVEGMRRALEAWNNYAQYLGPAAIPQYQQGCAALAAWEEATRG